MNKEQLQKIVSQDYNLPVGKDEFEAVQEVISILGSTDPELRDELGYSVLNRWLLTKDFLNNKQLEILLDQAFSEKMLFYKIGESNTDSVFLRSFSSLLIALLLIRDNRNEFLHMENYQQVITKVAAYCELEKDDRGYIEKKGWAHAPAHIADVIDECVKSRYTGIKECELLMNASLSLIQNGKEVFTAEEDERISLAVCSMVEQNKVPISILMEWLKKQDAINGRNMVSRNRRINFKHFLRCLYFRLEEKSLLSDSREDLLTLEKKFNPFHSY